MTGTKGALCHFSSSATHVYMLKVSITVIPPTCPCTDLHVLGQHRLVLYSHLDLVGYAYYSASIHHTYRNAVRQNCRATRYVFSGTNFLSIFAT